MMGAWGREDQKAGSLTVIAIVVSSGTLSLLFFLAIFSFVKIVIFFNVRLSVVTDNNYRLIVTNNYRLNCIELSMSALNCEKEKQ